MHTIIVSTIIYDQIRLNAQFLDFIKSTENTSDISFVINLCFLKNDISQQSTRLIETLRQPNVHCWTCPSISLAKSLNISKAIAKKIFEPSILSFLEDDHVPSLVGINFLTKIIPMYTGNQTDNGFRAGMFTLCDVHIGSELIAWRELKNDMLLSIPSPDSSQLRLGGCNNCFRSASVFFWDNIAGDYGEDGYPISNYQTMQQAMVSYHKGYTPIYVSSKKEKLMYSYDDDGRGRGSKDPNPLKLWDKEFSRFDSRAKFRLG